MSKLFLIFILFLNLHCDKNINTSPHAPTLLWQSSFNNGLSYSIIPVVYKDIVVYSTYDGSDAKFKLVAFNKLTGEKKWEWRNTLSNYGYFISSTTEKPIVYKNILYLRYIGNYNQILKIDLNTGLSLNNNTLAATYNKFIVKTLLNIKNYLVYYVLDINFRLARLFVYNIETDQITKIYDYQNNSFPSMLDFNLYQNIDNQNKLIARIQHARDDLWQIVDSTFDLSYNLDNNKPVFYKKFDANNKPSSILTAGDKYYYSLSGRYTQFINEKNGNIELNKYQYNNPGGYYKNKLFVFWDTRENSCISADDGYQIWANRDYNFASEYIFYNDKIYNGNMCVDANTGKLLWSIDTEGGYQNIVTIDPETGNIYTATFTGPVCFKNVP